MQVRFGNGTAEPGHVEGMDDTAGPVVYGPQEILHDCELTMKRFLLSLLLAGLIPARADLQAYLARPEPAFQWSEASKSVLNGCEVRLLRLTSQEWQGIRWEHDVIVFRPLETPFAGKLFLMNSGGSAKEKDYPYGAMLAARIKAPVAFLLGIPRQPLFGGKKEDALIAETFVRYLETGDASWPLLFPMTKSLVKCMDALQECFRREWQEELKSFIVSGASKRGWTTWLTAASDPRVEAIAPMVIDTLNMREQLPHQVKMFGRVSDSIRDYTERGLVPIPDTDNARRLWGWVDPFLYRDKFTMPKLIVCGTNDPYWSTDALNLYWDGLPARKWISYSPNAGHNLDCDGSGGEPKGPWRAINSVAAFVRHQITGQPLPSVSWKHGESADGRLQLSITAEPPPREVRLWRAVSDSTDFRKAKWTSEKVTAEAAMSGIALERPSAGHIAFFADAGYEIDEIPFTLCTQMRIAAAAAADSGTGAGGKSVP